MKKQFFLFLILLFSLVGHSQNVAIGSWKDNLSYKNGIGVTQGNGQVYCLTQGGIIIYHIAGNSIERLSKINGLSDIQPSAIAFNSFNNKVLIAYKNSNIDIIDNGIITNIVDIKMKSMMGSKTVNSIYFINQLAYLSCAFGIVVIDMDRYEVKDTYYIGLGGSNINVRAVTSDDTYMYAATDNGIYRVLLSVPDPENFAEWSLMTGLPNGIYNAIATFNGKIYTNYSKFLSSNITQQDTMFVYNGTIWNHFTSNNNVVNSLHVNNTKLLITYNNAIAIYNSNETLENEYTNYPWKTLQPSEAVLDNSNNLWIADEECGLVSKNNGANFEYQYPNGPNSVNVIELNSGNGTTWVAPGNANKNLYAGGLYSNSANEWMNVTGDFSSIINFDTVYNINHILVNPKNAGIVYASATNGIIELHNGIPVKLYNNINSPLKTSGVAKTRDSIVIGGMAVDSSGNLWVANSNVSPAISVKKTDGTWKTFDFSFVIGNSPLLGQILIDQNNKKWIVVKGKGVLVYNDNGSAPNSYNTKLITSDLGNGYLPDNNIDCMISDSDGNIWFGSEGDGLKVIYSPQNVFMNQNFDANNIYVQQDNTTQLLFETEVIPAMAVDPANRKWISIKGAGVFLLSSDGTQQIYHFTQNNSPLLSDTVTSIAINQIDGEVYFATPYGIVSYRSTATQGANDYSKTYVFPNPVKHDYLGVIAITGLVNNSTIKITDISGALVYETQSAGGQAIWDGKNNKGDRVATGVYMVFCTSEDGSQTLATKILFIN
jgi:ligand-binding sensor domain-containing protein